MGWKYCFSYFCAWPSLSSSTLTWPPWTSFPSSSCRASSQTSAPFGLSLSVIGHRRAKRYGSRGMGAEGWEQREVFSSLPLGREGRRPHSSARAQGVIGFPSTFTCSNDTAQHSTASHGITCAQTCCFFSFFLSFSVGFSVGAAPVGAALAAVAGVVRAGGDVDGERLRLCRLTSGCESDSDFEPELSESLIARRHFCDVV